MPDAAIKAHWSRVIDLGCAISGRSGDGVQIHHCHGGSMRQFGQLRGTGQKVSDWLVIPLYVIYHTGCMGIDSGSPNYYPDAWEEKFGTQVSMLDAVSECLGYSVWEKAGIDRRIP